MKIRVSASLPLSTENSPKPLFERQKRKQIYRTTPKENQTPKVNIKEIRDRADKINNAWKEDASKVTFGGVTPTNYETQPTRRASRRSQH